MALIRADDRIAGMHRLKAYFVSHEAYWHAIRRHPLFAVAAVLWGLFGLGSLFLPFFPRGEAWFYGLSYLPKWPWYVWVIGLLSLAFVAVVEASRSEMERQNKLSAEAERPEPSGASWAALYDERKRVQDDLEALEAEPEPPDVPFMAALPIKMRTLRDDWRDRERARRIKHKKAELKVIDDLLKGAGTPKAEIANVSGPNVVVEYSYSKDDLNKKGDAPLVLKNISSTDAAKNVRVLPLRVGDLTATFEPDIIPFIEPLGTSEAKILIDGVFPTLRHCVPILLKRAFKDESLDEVFTPHPHILLIEYEDANNNLCFETSATLRYTQYHNQVSVGETKRQVKPRS